MTLNRSTTNIYISPSKNKQLNKSAEIKKQNLSITDLRYYRELPENNYFSDNKKLTLNVINHYKSPVSKKKELCTSCINKEIIKNREDEENCDNSFTSDYFRSNVNIG